MTSSRRRRDAAATPPRRRAVAAIPPRHRRDAASTPRARRDTRPGIDTIVAVDGAYDGADCSCYCQDDCQCIIKTYDDFSLAVVKGYDLPECSDSYYYYNDDYSNDDD